MKISLFVSLLVFGLASSFNIKDFVTNMKVSEKFNIKSPRVRGDFCLSHFRPRCYFPNPQVVLNDEEMITVCLGETKANALLTAVDANCPEKVENIAR